MGTCTVSMTQHSVTRKEDGNSSINNCLEHFSQGLIPGQPVRMRQEKTSDSGAAFPYKVKRLWSGILTTFGGGIVCIEFSGEARIFCSSLPKMYSIDRYVCKVQTLPHSFSQWCAWVTSTHGGFWTRLLSWIQENKHVSNCSVMKSKVTEDPACREYI